MKKPLWTPSEERIINSNMTRFMGFLRERQGREFSTYAELYDWSVTDLASFWGAVWEFCGVITTRPYTKVIDDPTRMPGNRWFTCARLNFAENLLRFRDERPAIIFRGEGGGRERISHGQLFARVASLAEAMCEAGVGPGDRVAAFMPNIPERVIAMLATTSLGAVWNSSSPKFGSRTILEGLGQIEPKILFTTDGYRYGGKSFDSLEGAAGIAEMVPSISRVIVVPYLNKGPRIEEVPSAILYGEFVSGNGAVEPHFIQLPSGHPLYIMYSSGTTGPPKCLVQGTAGVLVNHLKELVLHTDLKRDDIIFCITDCGGMMWNWLVSSLAVGATIVLYDGNPLYPHPGVLWRIAQEEGVTVFGASARYLAAMEKIGLHPGRDNDLSRLRTVLSTGSPLPAEGFRYVYREVRDDLQLSSISGDTDLNGCFALGNPIAPVYEEELQCRGLGMKVEVFDESGEPVVGERGELVCTAPFPSMPLHLWSDPDGSRYLKEYFSRFHGVWSHGDWCELTESGGMIIHGRSDTTLNCGGIRIGTVEIYRLVESLPEIDDSIVVARRCQGDEKVVLFLKMVEGGELTDDLEERVRVAIGENVSPRHVPAKIIAVAEIPYTINMRKAELAVRNVINGKPVRNLDALVNPEALGIYMNLPEMRE